MDVPLVEHLDAVLTSSMQNAHQVCEDRLPHTQLKLMHEIWHKE